MYSLVIVNCFKTKEKIKKIKFTKWHDVVGKIIPREKGD